MEVPDSPPSHSVVEGSDAADQENDNSSLKVLCFETRCKSPVAVQEWVASLVPDNDDGDDLVEENAHDAVDEETDNLTLGAEGHIH